MKWAHDRDSMYLTNNFRTDLQPPEGVDPIPGNGVVYFRFALAPGKTLLAAAQPDVGQQQAWFDRDFDGQLTDEAPRELEGRGWRARTSCILPWSDGTGATPHTITVEIEFGRNGEKGRVWLRPLAHREADVVIGGRMRRVVAASGDSDLRFDDEEEDRIYVDLDGDGRVTTGDSSHERVVPGIPFRAGEHGYRIELADPAATGVRVTLSDPAPLPRPRAWPTPPGQPRRPSVSFTSFQSLGEQIAEYNSLKSDKSGSGFSFAARTLKDIGYRGTVDAVKFLVRVAREEKIPELHIAAADALGTTVNAPHAKLVMNAARKTKAPERQVALFRAIDRMDAQGRELFYVDLLDTLRDDAARAACADCAALVGSDARSMLTSRIATFRQPASGYFAYRAATRCDPSPPPEWLLTVALQSRDARLRLLALADTEWLGIHDTHAQIVAIATEELGHRRATPELARLIIDSLGPVAGAADVPLLFDSVPFATREVRNHLVDLASRVRDPAVEEAIRSRLTSKDAAVRLVAARVLASLPDAGNAGALAHQLPIEPDPQVRIALVTAMGKRSVPGAAPHLLAILRKAKNDKNLLEATRIAIARIGFQSPEIAAYFESEANATAWVARLDTTDIVARYSGPTAVPYLIERLADSEWRVRVAAAQGLGRLRVREAVGALIARLETEEDPRARRAVADALFRTTGQYLYDIHKLWVKWWMVSGNGFVVPAAVPTRDEKKGGRKTVASFYGVPVESERAIFVIDQSGSMDSFAFSGEPVEKESDFDRAVQETLKVVGKMPDGSKINVIFFESSIHPWSHKLVKLGTSSRARLQSHLRKQQPMGGTNLYDGLELALLTNDVDTIYLLSDGAPGEGRFVEDEDILREIGKRNKRRRIQIHCISLGTDSSLLKALAEQSGGTYTKR